MEMKDVKSSQFKRVGYDPATQTMQIDFGQSSYTYANVTQKDYDEFMAADSLGRHFGQTFKKSEKFPFTRLSDEVHKASQPAS